CRRSLGRAGVVSNRAVLPIHPQICIQINIVRCSAAGDDVGEVVAGEVDGEGVFGGDAAVVEDVFFPGGGGGVSGVVDVEAGAFDLAGGGVAVSGEDFVVSVVVEVSEPEGMAAAEGVVEFVAGPFALLQILADGDGECVAVHGFDRGEV